MPVGKLTGTIVLIEVTRKMKNVALKILLIIGIILLPVFVFAADCQTGGMSEQDYSYFIGLVSLICAFLFCVGINQ